MKNNDYFDFPVKKFNCNCRVSQHYLEIIGAIGRNSQRLDNSLLAYKLRLSRSVWLLIDSQGIGGIETHVLQLARALCDFEIDVEIVLMNDYGPHQLLFHSSRTPIRQLQGVRDLGIALRRDRPSLVHTHGYKAGIVGRLVCRWNRVPVVSTFHSGDRGRGKLRFYTMLDELTAGLAPSIAVSGEIGNRLFARATVIPNFVAISQVRAAPKRERKIVAFVGRLSEEKGPEIFCRFADRLPSLEFHVFGDGPMRRELEASSNRPVFKGLVADMNLVWPNIDLLCITSRTEGLPLVALEAMSRGIPGRRTTPADFAEYRLACGTRQ